jgi:hypothetical protein
VYSKLYSPECIASEGIQFRRDLDLLRRGLLGSGLHEKSTRFDARGGRSASDHLDAKNFRIFSCLSRGVFHKTRFEPLYQPGRVRPSLILHLIKLLTWVAVMLIGYLAKGLSLPRKAGVFEVGREFRYSVVSQMRVRFGTRQDGGVPEWSQKK